MKQIKKAMEEKSFFKGLFGSTEKQPTNILQIIHKNASKDQKNLKHFLLKGF